MSQRQISIIIPAPQFNSGLPVLSALAACGLDRSRYEILVAEGTNPSRQRNLAMQKAQGDFFLFLDSDCLVNLAYFDRLQYHLQSLEFDVLGGPAVLPLDSPPLQKVFQSTLAHPLVVGSTAARYAPHGSLRRSNENELILCSLAVRAEFFRKTGKFNEILYPNEENEWLDRAAKSARVYYDPDWRVYRPQRETWFAFARMLLRYGVGRTRQFFTGRRFSPKQLPPLFLLVMLGLLLEFPTATALAALFFATSYILLLAATQPKNSTGNRILTGMAGLCVPFFYALGQVAGLFTLLARSQSAGPEIRIFNERGEPITVAAASAPPS